jgi:hypothetical protein
LELLGQTLKVSIRKRGFALDQVRCFTYYYSIDIGIAAAAPRSGFC